MDGRMDGWRDGHMCASIIQDQAGGQELMIESGQGGVGVVWV